MSPSCRLTVTIRPARDEAELEAARALRVEVFCGEQGVSREEEFDEHDATALHLVALDQTGVIATCRLREVEPGVTKLERMAVAKRLRRNGVGAKLLGAAEEELRSRGAREIVLHAQSVAEHFYAASGYEPEGERFDEAGIDHIRMRKRLG